MSLQLPGMLGHVILCSIFKEKSMLLFTSLEASVFFIIKESWAIFYTDSTKSKKTEPKTCML